MHNPLAQGTVLWLPYVAGKLGYLFEQRVLREVTHRLLSSCCCCSICLSSSAETICCAFKAGWGSVANSDP
jgi:hypothetical protein